MLADQIIKGAKIFTSDKENPLATCLAVKDGTFVYVGDEAGLSDLEGEVHDLGGKFIMPGIIDSHVHVTMGCGYEFADMGEIILGCDSKDEAMDYIRAYVKDHPGRDRYRLILDKKYLHGASITKEDLDAICPDAELQIQEAQMHSIWVNSKILERHNIGDDTRDPVPGLSFYTRDEQGHVTGEMSEGACELPVILDCCMEKTDAEIDAALKRWIDFSVGAGVDAVFDAGIPGFDDLHERIYKRLKALDLEGRLPVYIDGCFVISAPWQVENGLSELRRMRQEYDTEHLKVHTLKVFQDGTLKLHTGAMVTPYADTGETGVTAFDENQIRDLLLRLNDEGLDLHLHCVGERSSRVVLDGVEMARRELGDDFHVRVTCAHLQIQDTADLGRFAKLGVIANYTPWWHCDDPNVYIALFGEERGRKLYRCKSVWDTGALVTWSSDNIVYMDFGNWSPYLGMEIGMTRWATEKTKIPEFIRAKSMFPPAEERMGIEEMILGYTINGAIQLGIEDRKGSIAVGKDADFLVFDEDLTMAEQAGFSYIEPSEVYFRGKRMN